MLLIYENDQKKIRLRLNLESARSAGLNVSSKLIQVAELERTSFLAPPRPQSRSNNFIFGANIQTSPAQAALNELSRAKKSVAGGHARSHRHRVVAGMRHPAYLRSPGRQTDADARPLDSANSIAANMGASVLYDNQKVAQEMLAPLKSAHDVINACLYDEFGHIYSTYPTNAAPALFPAAPGADGTHLSGAYLTIFQPVMEDDGRVGTLFIRQDLRGISSRFGIYVSVVLAVMFASAIVAWLLSRFLQLRIAKPILDLAAVARRISDKGDFSVRASNISAVEELALLNKAYNEMLDQIHSRDLSLEQARYDLQRHAEDLESRVAERTHSLEETTRQLYDFCYSIAHDLKAPIRSQAGYARILMKDFAEKLGPEGTGFAERIAESADRQTRLVSDLLTHVSLGHNEMPMESVDLATIKPNRFAPICVLKLNGDGRVSIFQAFRAPSSPIAPRSISSSLTCSRMH